MVQQGLFDRPTRAAKRRAFSGSTYDPNEDFERLTSVLRRVRHLMVGERGRWWTLAELAARTGASEAGVSARIRDLRKRQNGGYNVENRRRGDGLWVYRVSKGSTHGSI
ncbi:MAG: hypothetical protein CL793_07495 [Chloroflexi bacterium]|nr:hypothetical protein [Chloroflexota bacterium]